MWNFAHGSILSIDPMKEISTLLSFTCKDSFLLQEEQVNNNIENAIYNTFNIDVCLIRDKDNKKNK